jgi:hypothetical protein
VNTTYVKLKVRALRTGHRCALGGRGLATLTSLTALTSLATLAT